MDILMGYGVGPRTDRILQPYLYHLSMVARTRRYYVTPFKARQGVTQGNPLSPTIFNMVFDAVIFHWIILVTREEVGPDSFRWSVQWLAALFYADDGLIPLPRMDRLQLAVYVLTGFFLQCRPTDQR